MSRDDSKRFQQASRISKRSEEKQIGDETRGDATPPESPGRKGDPLERPRSPPNPCDQSFHPSRLSREKATFDPSAGPSQPHKSYIPILPPDFDPSAPWPARTALRKMLPKMKMFRQGIDENVTVAQLVQAFEEVSGKKMPSAISRKQEYRDMMNSLVDIIRRYEPDFSRELIDKPTAIVNAIEKILLKLDKEWRLLPLEFQEMKGLLGTRWSYQVKQLEERVKAIIDDHAKQRAALFKELSEKEAEIIRLKGQVTYNENLVQQCKFRNLPRDQKSLAHTTALLVQSEIENELLQVELAKWKEQYETIAAKLIAEDRELAKGTMGKIAECVDIVKEIKLWANDELTRYVSQQIARFTKMSKEEVLDATEEHMEMLKAVYEDVKEKIEELKDTSRLLDKDYADYLALVTNLEGFCADLSYKAVILEDLAEVRKEQNSSLIEEIQELEEVNSYLAFKSGANKTSTPTAANLQYSMGSPEQFRLGSPSGLYAAENIVDTQSISFEDSRPESPMPAFTLTPPSPLRSPATSYIVGPGTQTLAPPQSRFTIDPSTQNISGVSNRFDIGRGLNMHTVHSGPPSPYNQVTRVDSTISPQPGPSRMLDNPLHVQHRANVTPPPCHTPWISTQSRYGYTDPSFKMLNLPPGGFLEMNTALKKQVMLMSPQREEPLLVNIDVDPKPLLLTEDGEHFICDISLDVQPQAGRQKPPHISPVYSYGVTPPITPTADRRQGPFTPTSIFKKHHYNLRWLEDKFDSPGYDSPGKYFQPHYLPDDGRSPVSHLSPVSLLSDRTISWERIPGVEDEPVIKPPWWRYPDYIPSPHSGSSVEEESLSPVIRGIIDQNSSLSEYSDSSFERTPPSQRSVSPQMNRTFDRSPSPRLDGTFERSQSPVIRGFVDMSSSVSDNGSFERSASPVMNRTFERSPSPRLDGTFERSQSPMIRGFVDMSSSLSNDGSFERSVSPAMNRTFERSPSPRLDGTFERSQSPVIRGFVDTSSSLSNDESFERSSSPLRVSFDPLHRVHRFRTDEGYLDMISSPSTDGSFDRSVSPRMNATFERSQSPSPLSRVYRFNTTQGRGCLDMSSSPSTGGSYDRSASPQMNATFERSSSPLMDRSFDSHYGGVLNQTFDSHTYGPPQDNLSRSMQSVGSVSHSMSPRTFNSDMSSCNSGYDNPFNPNDSVLSPSGMSPHDVFNSSMPPRMGGVFSNKPSRLTRTF